MSSRLGAMLSLSMLMTWPGIAAQDVPAPQGDTSARCEAILQEGLKDRNPDKRKQAVVALSLVGRHPNLLAELVEALADKDVEVRLAAIASLTEIPSVEATAALKSALEDDVPEVSFAAAKALWTLRDDSGKQALMAVLQGESKTSSSYFSKQKRDALRMMHTPRTMFLTVMREGVGFVPVPGVMQGVSSMQALLTDPGVSGRATAALLLGKEKEASTVVALKDALDDKDWSVRAAAVHSLALQDDPGLRDALLPLLDDHREAVRMRAAAAYLRLSGPTQPDPTISLREGSPVAAIR